MPNNVAAVIPVGGNLEANMRQKRGMIPWVVYYSQFSCKVYTEVLYEQYQS